MVLFENPIKYYEIYDEKQVLDILKDVSNSKLYVVTAISYEAAVIFDEAHEVQKDKAFPFL